MRFSSVITGLLPAFDLVGGKVGVNVFVGVGEGVTVITIGAGLLVVAGISAVGVTSKEGEETTSGAV